MNTGRLAPGSGFLPPGYDCHPQPGVVLVVYGWSHGWSHSSENPGGILCLLWERLGKAAGGGDPGVQAGGESEEMVSWRRNALWLRSAQAEEGLSSPEPVR